MFTDAEIFAVILLMNPSLRIPTPIRTLIVASTRAKGACLAHKPKRRKRGQPGEPFRGIWHNGQFSLLWTDEHIVPLRSIFNQRDEPAAFFCRMARQRSHDELRRARCPTVSTVKQR